MIPSYATVAPHIANFVLPDIPSSNTDRPLSEDLGRIESEEFAMVYFFEDCLSPATEGEIQPLK